MAARHGAAGNNLGEVGEDRVYAPDLEVLNLELEPFRLANRWSGRIM